MVIYLEVENIPFITKNFRFNFPCKPDTEEDKKDQRDILKELVKELSSKRVSHARSTPPFGKAAVMPRSYRSNIVLSRILHIFLYTLTLKLNSIRLNIF